MNRLTKVFSIDDWKYLQKKIQEWLDQDQPLEPTMDALITSKKLIVDFTPNGHTRSIIKVKVFNARGAAPDLENAVQEWRKQEPHRVIKRLANEGVLIYFYHPSTPIKPQIAPAIPRPELKK